MISCPELITLIKGGVPVRFRRHSPAYVRLTEISLAVISAKGEHLCLWLAKTGKFKSIMRALPPAGSKPYLALSDWLEIVVFLRKWEEMRQMRNWAPGANFPHFTEIAAFCYLTLVPEHWQIYTEENGQVLPLFEHEELHCDVLGDEAE